MKKHLILIIAALLFSTLFYDQRFGLNMLLFAIVAIGLSFFFQRAKTKHSSFKWAAALYLLSSIFVFTVNSGLSQVTYFIAFLVFAGSISGENNAVYVQWFNGMYQSTFGALHGYIHRNTSTPRPKQKNNAGFILLAVTIIGAITLLFVNLYGAANPVFGAWVGIIDFSFLNIQWLILAMMGYVLLGNLTTSAELDIMTTADRQAPLYLEPQEIPASKLSLLAKENSLGGALMITLNLLILLYICADALYLFQSPLEDAVALSRTVHEGVRALITSIVIAITLILVLFRGNLNFYKRSARLRSLTYIWIGLNILIILLTAYKNFLYSTGFGLTYRRIGVFIYLIICISGMVTTYFKIARKHKLLFMFRANARVAFIVLILMGSFNWSRTITRFNLNTLQYPDMNYLLNLAPDNGDLLYAFAKANPSKVPNHDRIHTAYDDLQHRLTNETWQSKTLLGIQISNDTTYEVSRTSY